MLLFIYDYKWEKFFFQKSLGHLLRFVFDWLVFARDFQFVHETRGGSRNLFWGGPNQGPQSKVAGEARIEGAKRPSIEGEARVEGAKRPRIEGEARAEGEAREKSGGGVWGGGSVSPSPENFWKIKLETNHFGAYLKQLFEMTNEMV